MPAPPRHGGGEEPSALHRVGPWIPVTPVVLVPTLAGGDKIWNLRTRMLLRTLRIPGFHYQIAWTGPDRFATTVLAGQAYNQAGRGAFVEFDLTGKRLGDLHPDWRIIKTSTGSILQRVVVSDREIIVQRAGGVERRVTLPEGWNDFEDGMDIAPVVSADDSAVALVRSDLEARGEVVHVWHFDAATSKHLTHPVRGLLRRLELTADGEQARLEGLDYPSSNGEVSVLDLRNGVQRRIGPWDLAWASRDYSSTAISADGVWAATLLRDDAASTDMTGMELEGQLAYFRRHKERLATSIEMRRTGKSEIVWRWSSTITGPGTTHIITSIVFPTAAPVVVLSLGGGQLVMLDRERGVVRGRLGAMPAVARLMTAPDPQHLITLLDRHRVVEWDLSRAVATEIGEIEGTLGKEATVEIVQDRVMVSRVSPDPRAPEWSLEVANGTFDALPGLTQQTHRTVRPWTPYYNLKPDPGGALWAFPGNPVAVSFVEDMALVETEAGCLVVDMRTGSSSRLEGFKESTCDAKEASDSTTVKTTDEDGRVVFSFQGRNVIGYWTRTSPGNKPVYTRVVMMWSASGKRQLSNVLVTDPRFSASSGRSTVGIFDIPQMTALSPDGDTLAIANNRTLWRIDVATGKSTTRVSDSGISSVAWLPRGDALLVSHDDGVVERHHKNGVERATGDPLAIFVVSPDGSWFAGPGYAGAIQVWTMSPLRSATTLLGFQDHEYLAYTPDGYYSGTADVGDRVAWVFEDPLEGFGFDQYASQFNRPDIVSGRLTGKTDVGGAVAHRPPSLSITATASGATARVKATASSGGRVDLVRFFVDGRPAGSRNVCAAAGSAELEIPIHSGINRITGVAYDGAGLASTWQTVEVTGRVSSRLPKLWVVSVGVSRYPKLTAEQQLEAADDDARAIASSFRGATTGVVFRDVDVSLLVDAEATSDRVSSALRRLEGMAEDDLAVVFLAGHGVRSSAGDMVFLTSEVSSDRLDVGGIGWATLAGQLSRARGRIVVFLDACHSGHFSRNVAVSSDDLAHAFAKDRRAGALVFSAAKGRQLSYEPNTTRSLVRTKNPLLPAATKNHGLFTAALLDAFEDSKTDLDRNGDLELSEIIAAVTERVSAQTGGLQTPWVARREIHGDLRIGIAAKHSVKTVQP